MTTVDVLLYDALDELDAVAPLEVLAAAGFTCSTVALDNAGPVTGAHGVRIGVDAGLGDPSELLVIPGGGWMLGPDAGARAATSDGRLLDWIRTCHAAGAVIASVCSGAFMLEAAGLLGGDRPVVTHHLAADALRKTGANVLSGPRVVDDGELLSSGGVTAGLDLTLHLIERQLGPDASRTAAERLEYQRQGTVLVTDRGKQFSRGARP